MKKIIVIFAAAMLLIMVIGSCSKAKKNPTGPTGPTQDSNGYYTVSSAGSTFKWKVDGANLDCKLSAATTGWIGVGFGPDGTMADAQNFIMGYVTPGNAVTISDMNTTGHSAPAPDTIQNITNVVGTESGDTTEIDFTIPMNSGDPQDMVLTQGMGIWILLASGPNGADNFTTPHGPSAYGAVQTNLD
jgi:hypothetical protein